MREIEIELSESPAVVVARARALAADRQWPFDGTEAGGEFEAMGVAGKYVILPGRVLVTITSKPFLFPWPLVEDKVRDFFR